MSPDFVELNTIAEVRLGRQRTPKDHDGTQMRPYLRAANVGWDGLKLDDVKSMNFTDREMSVYQLRPGDLLLSEASGSPSEVGKPALWDGELEECAFQNTLIRVRPRSVDPRFLLHFFRHEAASGAFARGARGVGIHHIGQAALAQWRVPHPPIEEQRRVVAVLDEASALLAKSRSCLEQLEALAESIFFEMFESARPSWPLTTLREVAQVKGGKRLPKGARYASEVTQHPYIRVVDIKEGAISRHDLRYLTPEVQKQISSYTVNIGDVIISIAGSIGLVAEVPEQLVGANLTENAAKIVPRREGDYSAGWLAATLRSPGLQAQIQSHVGQVTIKKLALFRIEKLQFSLPPLDLQREYLTRVGPISGLIASRLWVIGAMEELFESLQARAFS